jgi:hypothetical protein
MFALFLVKVAQVLKNRHGFTTALRRASEIALGFVQAAKLEVDIAEAVDVRRVVRVGIYGALNQL